MDKVKSLFNHPRREDTEKNSHLFNWKRPSFQKDDVSQLNRLLKKLGKSGHATLHMKNKEIEPDHHVLSEGFESNRKLVALAMGAPLVPWWLSVSKLPRNERQRSADVATRRGTPLEIFFYFYILKLFKYRIIGNEHKFIKSRG